MPEKPTIYLVDDDYGPMDYYVAALESIIPSHRLIHIDSADAAQRIIDDPITTKPALVIQDLMMPAQSVCQNGTTYTLRNGVTVPIDYGSNTGIILIDKWRYRFHDLVIVCRTNMNEDQIPAVLSELLPEERIIQKFETSPFGFARKISHLLQPQ